MVRPGAATRRVDETGLTEHLQMVGDRRLREVERVDEIADADLAGCGQLVDDRDARRVGERLELRRELVALVHRQRLRRRAAADRRQGRN